MRVARGEHRRRPGERPRAVHGVAGAVPAGGLLLQGVSRPAFSALGAPHPRAVRARHRIDCDAPRERTPKRYAFCDVLVIGAGPQRPCGGAGGGGCRRAACCWWTRTRSSAAAPAGAVPLRRMLAALIERVAQHPRHRSAHATCAAGYYADRWVALVEPDRDDARCARGAVVFATGVIEQPAVFRNNDLPGVMLGSAAQRLLHRHRDRAGPARGHPDREPRGLRAGARAARARRRRRGGARSARGRRCIDAARRRASLPCVARRACRGGHGRARRRGACAARRVSDGVGQRRPASSASTATRC